LRLFFLAKGVSSNQVQRARSRILYTNSNRDLISGEMRSSDTQNNLHKFKQFFSRLIGVVEINLNRLSNSGRGRVFTNVISINRCCEYVRTYVWRNFEMWRKKRQEQARMVKRERET